VPAAMFALLSLSHAAPAGAAAGDVYKEGTEWCASTYQGHGTLSGYGPPLDLNGKGGVNDLGWPVHAPEDGSVTVHSQGYGSGWGNSIIWRSADGTEKIHMAHLDQVGATGKVGAGDVIGRVGKTGEATGPHLHVSARRGGEPAKVELMGKIIHAGQCYVSSGPIPPLCLGQPATIMGGGEAEVLVGTPEPDVILGRGGGDEIRARAGHDVVCGGEGKDLVLGLAGQDRLRGDEGADVLQGGPGQDDLRGKDGPDSVIGGGGSDMLFGESGNDELEGGTGADRVSGGPGNDTASYLSSQDDVTVRIADGVATGQGEDILITMESARGSSFGDHLIGDAGTNRLRGAPGDDVLRGKGGHDALNGGGGFDTCKGGEQVVGCET
jgi:Ca2+-binding RTX toxin-like protein